MSDVLSRLLGEEFVLSDRDVAAYAVAHQLSEEVQEGENSGRLERQVSQWIAGQFVSWEEYLLDESGERIIRLVSPEAKWLSRSEAVRLICAARTQGQVEALSELAWEDSRVA